MMLLMMIKKNYSRSSSNCAGLERIACQMYQGRDDVAKTISIDDINEDEEKEE